MAALVRFGFLFVLLMGSGATCAQQIPPPFQDGLELPPQASVKFLRDEPDKLGSRIRLFYTSFAVREKAIGGPGHLARHLSADESTVLLVYDYVLQEEERLRSSGREFRRGLFCAQEVAAKDLSEIIAIGQRHSNSEYVKSFQRIAARFGLSVYQQLDGWMRESTQNAAYDTVDVAVVLESQGRSVADYVDSVCGQ